MIEALPPDDTDDEMDDWRDAGKQHLLEGYADEDAVYDELGP
jgi:hypothetical protein